MHRSTAVSCLSVMLTVLFTMLIPASPGQAQSQSAAASPNATPTMAAGPAMLSLMAMPGYGTAPLTVGFMVSSMEADGEPFVSYQWNFGDGKVAEVPPTVLFHTYTKPGSYIVTLTATTASGRMVTAMTGVIVRSRAP